jgi:hypothetical protein
MQGDVAGREIEAGLADMLAELAIAFAHRDVAVGLIAILLNHDGVGAGWHLRAGEDARRFARADRAGRQLAGGDALHDLEFCGEGVDIGGADGIAIHRRHIGRRLRQARFQRFG